MITDNKIELEILKKVFVKNKEPDELLRVFIKLNKTNGKNRSRILTIKEDQKGMNI